ncbi:hypothetical protein [Acinetobacter baumannii]|uniref:hypothetical protein n=1 Tax=Acinetobacter baumannii TaxID=470 RepID=UPI000BF2A52D|nr:hypothetical protein [Acinetobacter baumannii]
MKPEQFIREQGLDAIKDCIKEAKAYGGFYVNAKTLELSKHIPSYDAVSIIELMRLVESLDRIDKCGGLYGFKTYCNGDYSQEDLRAIRDHESIYGGGDE